MGIRRIKLWDVMFPRMGGGGFGGKSIAWVVDNLTKTLEVSQSLDNLNKTASYEVKAGDKYAEVLGISTTRYGEMKIGYAGVMLACNTNTYNGGGGNVRVGTFIDLSDGVGKKIEVTADSGGRAYVYIYR